MVVSDSKNKNPQDEIDINDPYWNEKVHMTDNVTRWQKHLLSNTEYWKGKRSRLHRDYLTELLRPNGVEEIPLHHQLKEVIDQQKTLHSREMGIRGRLLMQEHEREKQREDLEKVDRRELEIAQDLLSLAKRLYLKRKTQEIYDEASDLDELGWIEDNLKDLVEQGYDKKPEAALKELQNLIEKHQSEWDAEPKK